MPTGSRSWRLSWRPPRRSTTTTTTTSSASSQHPSCFLHSSCTNKFEERPNHALRSHTCTSLLGSKCERFLLGTFAKLMPSNPEMAGPSVQG